MYEETNSQMICKLQSIRQFQEEFLVFLTQTASSCLCTSLSRFSSFSFFFCLLLLPNTLQIRFSTYLLCFLLKKMLTDMHRVIESHINDVFSFIYILSDVYLFIYISNGCWLLVLQKPILCFYRKSTNELVLEKLQLIVPKLTIN